MVSSRSKLKERGLVQIAVWLSSDSASTLKRLAAERGLSATKIVEQAITTLAGLPAEPTAPAAHDFDLWNRVSELAAALERTNARLAALEAPTAPAERAVGRKPGPEQETAETGPVVAMPSTRKRRQHQPERDTEIIRLFNSGIGGSPAISKALLDIGIHNSKGSPIDPGVILGVLKRAGLK